MGKDPKWLTMKIICDKCENIINRDYYVDEKLIVEYNNVYGTICPNCGHRIMPINRIDFKENKDLKMEILREEMRDKIRKKIQGEK